MHRNPLLQLLARYRSRFNNEVNTVDRLIAFVREHPDCFKRSLQSGHVTGSAWVVDPNGHRVLLTHHRKLARWLQLGGHADGNPDILDVAMREAREESGISGIAPVSTEVFDVDIHPIPARAREPEHFHYDVRFALQVAESTAFTVSDESHDLQWVEIESLQDYSTEASMLRMARKWLQHQPG